MKKIENNSAPPVCYLIELPQGICELWVRKTKDRKTLIYEALKVVPVSGRCDVALETVTIAEAIALEEWMADHIEVFKEGRTSIT